MGMKQKRCPMCGKLRPYHQGNSDNDTRHRNERWRLVGSKLVCARCATKTK